MYYNINMNIKQVIVIRKDLGMRKGKMCAQAAHASMAVLTNRMWHTEDPVMYVLDLTDDMVEWAYSGVFTKIVVGCDSEEELLSLQTQANDAGLPTALIMDAGKTEFNGVPTYTALAVGPAKSDEIDKITGDLDLL